MSSEINLQVSYSQARENLASILDEVTENSTIAIIKRRGRKDVAMLPADELSSLLETVYLLRSPANAKQLFEALEWSKARDKENNDGLPASEAIAKLKKEIGFD
ncbi:MAG: type II toxin-antitoxin system Phd/YefM family antitoxin [Xenococcaceae cyanobacterium]